MSSEFGFRVEIVQQFVSFFNGLNDWCFVIRRKLRIDIEHFADIGSGKTKNGYLMWAENCPNDENHQFSESILTNSAYSCII